MKDNALVVVKVGEHPQAESSLRSLQAYAKKWKLDFVPLLEPKVTPGIKWLPLAYEKYQVVDVLPLYQQVLLVELGMHLADTEYAPKIDWRKPTAAFWAPVVTPWVTHQLLSFQRLLHVRGALRAWDGKYFDTNLMLLNPSHSMLFALDLGTCPDNEGRHQLNFNRVLLRVPMRDLGVPPHNDGE